MYTLPNFNEDFAGRFDFDDDLPELTAAELAGIEAGYRAMVAEETARAKADSNGGRLVTVRVAEAEPEAVSIGAQEPPDDYRVFNRRQADGSFRPVSEFFDREDDWHPGNPNNYGDQ